MWTARAQVPGPGVSLAARFSSFSIATDTESTSGRLSYEKEPGREMRGTIEVH